MKRMFQITVSAVVISLLVSIAFAGSPGHIGPKDASEAKSYRNVDKSIIKLGPDEKIRVIVTLKSKATDASIESLKKGRAGSFEVLSKRWDLAYPNGLAANVTKKQFLELLNDPRVARVDIDRKVKIQLETANYWSGTTKARAAAPIGFNVTGDRDGSKYNYTKNDVVIAIVDTGIDPMHKDLNGINNGGTKKIIGWYDAVNSYTTPYDDNGHGTHVASIAAGEGDDNSRYKGVAPGAALVGIKVVDSNGEGSWSGIIDGVNWGIKNKDIYGIRIMSLSLGSSGASDGTDPLSVALNNAVNKGIVVTVAAGNSGPQKYTISSPGAATNVITVGAIADAGYLLKSLPSVSANGLKALISPDKQRVTAAGMMSLEDNGFYLAPFSSRGPTADNRVKPDVVAPGVMINAAQSVYPSTPDFHGGYWELSGTSMATPFVAGVAALMLDANYSLTPIQIKNYIRSSAEDYGITGCDIDYGCGRIRAYRAVGLAKTGSTPAGDQWVPMHARFSTYINDSTDLMNFPVSITSDNYPFASTLIMYDWSGGAGIDLDLYISDLANNQIGWDLYPSERQETVTIAPGLSGKYNILIYKNTGAGRYSLDISKQ